MNNIQSLQTVSIQFNVGTGGKIQLFKNGTDLGYFRITKTITANIGDNISVWCDADPGYVFEKLCTPDGACTTARPFNFQANMNISMTATFVSSTGCPTTDNTLLINGQSSQLSIKVGTAANVSVKLSSGAGKQWKLIRIIDTTNPAADTVLASGTLDSNGCGNLPVLFDKVGVYTLKGNWCNVWVGDYGAHCFSYDTLTNAVIVQVTSTQVTGGCNPATCDPSKNLCIAGTCIPKQLIFIGAAALLLLMMTGGKN